VHVKCGERVLSEADNWYVPARLTKEMSQVLENSDAAFGRAVQALHFQRRTLAVELAWRPLPEGWEMNPGLRGQAAVIKVGAATEVEMKEKKARVEDALHATPRRR